MKQFFKMFFASLFAMVVAGVIIIIIAVSVVAGITSKITGGNNTTDVAANSVLTIDLDKTLHEQGEDNALAAIDDEESFSAGLFEATKAIEHAKTDDKIKGILIKLCETSNGWAAMQQLHETLIDFHSSGKFIYAYGERIPQKAYYVATAADSIYLNPTGSMDLKGFYTKLTFFKGTLDKLNIVPEIFYAGKFKSATEPFRTEKMSEPNRIQIKAIQADVWNNFLDAVSLHTHANTDAINSWAQTGAVQFPDDALKYKLVDGLLYEDEMEQRIRKKTGQQEKDKIKYVSLDDYAENFKGNGSSKDNRIAVLFAEGEIVDGKKSDDYQIASEDFVKSIRKIRENDKIKAVVLRVNSPGGSALASEVILRELQLLHQKKPLIVSMGDVAASGGYYISCQADSIFALPNTITGSIGVFGMLFNIEGMMKDKLGVTFDTAKNAPYADFPTFTRTLSADESQRMQRSVDTIYAQFKRRVATGRKNTESAIDSIAQGRVWTGTDALQLGLVDAMGNLGRAVKSAAAKAGVSEYQLVTYPERVDKIEAFMRKFKMASVSAASVHAAVKNELGSDYDLYEQIKSLRNMNGKIQMFMPFKIELN